VALLFISLVTFLVHEKHESEKLQHASEVPAKLRGMTNSRVARKDTSPLPLKTAVESGKEEEEEGESEVQKEKTRRIKNIQQQEQQQQQQQQQEEHENTSSQKQQAEIKQDFKLPRSEKIALSEPISIKIKTEEVAPVLVKTEKEVATLISTKAEIMAKEQAMTTKKQPQEETVVVEEPKEEAAKKEEVKEASLAHKETVPLIERKSDPPKLSRQQPEPTQAMTKEQEEPKLIAVEQVPEPTIITTGAKMEEETEEKKHSTASRAVAKEPNKAVLEAELASSSSAAEAVTKMKESPESGNEEVKVVKEAKNELVDSQSVVKIRLGTARPPQQDALEKQQVLDHIEENQTEAVRIPIISMKKMQVEEKPIPLVQKQEEAAAQVIEPMKPPKLTRVESKAATGVPVGVGKVAATEEASTGGDKCDGDPFLSFPVDTFVPPKAAPLEAKYEFIDAQSKMMASIKKMTIGGQTLRDHIAAEVRVLQLLRHKLFCMYA